MTAVLIVILIFLAGFGVDYITRASKSRKRKAHASALCTLPSFHVSAGAAESILRIYGRRVMRFRVLHVNGTSGMVGQCTTIGVTMSG